MNTANSMLKRLAWHMLVDPLPKILGLVLISIAIRYAVKLCLPVAASHPWHLIPLALVLVVVVSIVAILSGIWYTPTYARGGGLDD